MKTRRPKPIDDAAPESFAIYVMQLEVALELAYKTWPHWRCSNGIHSSDDCGKCLWLKQFKDLCKNLEG